MNVTSISKNILALLFVVAIGATLGGCEGDTGPAGTTGPAGAQGAPGQDVDPATVDNLQDQIDDLTALTVEAQNVEPEQCAVCHSDAADDHFSVYEEYTNASALAMDITGVVSVANGDGTFTSTATFTITQNGAPYEDYNGLASLEQARVYAATYDSATRDYDADRSATRYRNFTRIGAGTYTATATAITFAPETSNAQVFGYIADGLLHTEHRHAATHVHLYEDWAADALAFGTALSADANSYVSNANVAGCEKCHGTPYLKHGYRPAEVAGIPDFAACKVCHFDDRDGGHEDWQILVADPERWAELHSGSGPWYDGTGGSLTAAEEATYAYKASLMNDVHMSHSMEFPYPQSMANCATCHEGKLTTTLADEFFVVETCKSCHPVTEPTGGTDSHRAPSLEALWEAVGITGHTPDLLCDGCHAAGNAFGAGVFSDKHVGYDPVIYTATGQRYSEMMVGSIDSASVAGNILTVGFSVTEVTDIPGIDLTNVVPTLFIGLYGYDTHNYIVYPHGRDDDRNRLTEIALDGSTTNPRFNITDDGSTDGVWEVEFDFTMWEDMVADGAIRRAEIGIAIDVREVVGERDSRSNGESDDVIYGMVAPSRTFSLVNNAFEVAGVPDVINEAGGCDNCHDLLATTFHSPTRGGNTKICKMCHNVTEAGSHLELASRSIDSYVHALHSMQPFDIGDVDFTNDVEAAKFDLHTGHIFPNFTILNCEACHNPGTYEVPDQSKTLPSLHSGTDTVADRSVGTIERFVTGPASRACGACHRAHYLNADDAGGLAAFNRHTKENGYFVENDTGVYDTVVETIMGYFQ
jgi:OmcA/MtrC family decaheme c-type cytochrome